jgi:allophanate hydrolase
VDISSLQELYRTGKRTPASVVEKLYSDIEVAELRPIWISTFPKAVVLDRAHQLEANSDSRSLPLYGIPFAVKDNINVAGLPTTAGCPAYVYTPTASATVIRRLESAGAIVIGKTNMDQFATGLVGTRSPYGACSSVFNEKYISGGSSSGSAVAVAKGQVCFALGTDTAGSGRIPAAFNQLVGLKPTRGLLSTTGVVPACQTLDCVSIFAETCADASRVFQVARGFDPTDSYSRQAAPGDGAAPWSGTKLRVGIPRLDALQFLGDVNAKQCYQGAIDAMASLGGEIVEIDYGPFRAVANLLYAGPWVAERFAAISEFITDHENEMDPTVRHIISGARKYSAINAFEASYRLAELRRETEKTWEQVDVLLLPTAPRAYTIAEIQADPITLNTNLGYYTNFVNLLDLAAVAVPAGVISERLPFSVSLIGPTFTDNALLQLADRLHRKLAKTLGGSDRLLADTPALPSSDTPPGCIRIAVVGAHLTGQPLNWQLTSRHGRLLETLRTQADYKLFALKTTIPPKPGLIHTPGFQGPGIEVEIWALPEDTVGSFINNIPPPLTIGNIRLANNQLVKGFLVEASALADAIEISQFGGWRNYLQANPQAG